MAEKSNIAWTNSTWNPVRGCERVKKLEDALGCPCEPNKADYIGILKKRIEELEKRAKP